MHRVNYIKRDHEEIFKGLLELEEIIDDKDLDYWELIRVFQSLIELLSKHGENERFLLDEISRDYYMQAPISKISLDPRKVDGHIRVINNAILSKDDNKIRVALDNDGRMLISQIKEHIFKEETVLDRLLFLHLLPKSDNFKS